jgi:hypothetical protein
MKYLLVPWRPKSSKHQILVENKTPTKTTRQRGYGLGVTFSNSCFSWRHNVSTNTMLLKYSNPSYSDSTRFLNISSTCSVKQFTLNGTGG